MEPTKLEDEKVKAIQAGPELCGGLGCRVAVHHCISASDHCLKARSLRLMSRR